MTQCPEFINYLMELLAPFGDVRSRRIFGAYGIFRGDLMFGIVTDETLYLKADDVNRADFEEGRTPTQAAREKERCGL